MSNFETEAIVQKEDLYETPPVPLINSKEYVEGRIENIIYNIYIQEKSLDSPKPIIASLKAASDLNEQKKDFLHCNIWEELRKEFSISMAATINQLYTNQDLISHIIHYLMSLPFTENSKKIIRHIVQYYDPSRTLIKSLIQTLVPTLENQEQSQINKINVILYTLNVLFVQQSPENSKFNSYIYLNGGQGLKVHEKVRWPFEKSGTICLWYNMSDQTKQCKLFEIVNAQKAGFEIVLKNRKIYFEKLKEKSGFSLMRNDSAFLCEAETNTDVKLWIEFEIRKKIFQKAFFINVVMNNFVLNNIEVDVFNNTANDYSINLFRNFHGKISSVLVFSHNLAKQVQNLNSKQGFTYENDIKNFSYMFDNLLSHVYLLYTAIRSKTYYKIDEKELTQCQQEPEHEQKKIFDKGIPIMTVVFDAINRRNGIIGPEACVYRNISIHKKEMILYGGLQTYIGFFDLLKFHAKISKDCSHAYSQALGEVIILFKNIFESKATSIQEAESINLFRLMSNFFIETEMAGFKEELIPKLKQLYVSLNNRCIKQKFIKKLIWGIPAGQFLQLSQLQHYINLVKGLYVEEIQNSLNVFNVKDIINFLLDKYDRTNCCFDHTRTSSIDQRAKIKKYPQVLAEYFKIIQKILSIKRLDSDVVPIIHQIIDCFALNVSPCFVEAVVKFLSDIFAKDDHIEKLFLQQFETCHQAKMGLFSALANSYSWRTKGNLIELILHIFGVKMFKDGGQKDLMALCIRYPTITVRYSSVKSTDIERSVDISEDKISLNSTNVRSFMAMRSYKIQEKAEQVVLLNDEEIIRIIWEWGTSKSVMETRMEDNQNPATIILMDLYKGSTYKLRKMITQLLFTNLNLILFTPDFVAWVIQCLLLCEYDYTNKDISDQILRKSIGETKHNLLKLISTYRTTIDEQEETVENELDIIKLILISVKSKYSIQISKLYHIIFLQISQELINSFYEELRTIKFQNQEKYEETIKHILSNCYKCILQYFIYKGNDDFEFEQESQMQENERQYEVLLAILEKIFEILVFMTAPGNLSLLDEGNAKRNQVMFELLFPEEGKGSQTSLLCFIFVCLQGLFDNYGDLKLFGQLKIVLTLTKKYLVFLIEISENSGNLRIQKFEQTLRCLFLNTLGFLQNKFYQYYFNEYSVQVHLFKGIDEIKNLAVTIFIQLIHLMKYIEECSCSKHKSFYELMKPKKKHKNINNIKNLFPIIWKKVDDKILEFITLNVDTLKQEEARNKLEEHLKMKRLYAHTISIEKTITKNIDQLLQKEKKENEVTERNSVFSYLRNEKEKCKILTEFEENIAIFMIESSNKQRSEEQQRRVESEAIRRHVKAEQKRIWNFNRIYEGFWANPQFYKYSQNQDTFLYDNTLQRYYKRVRSDRQTKYLLTPILSIQAKQLTPSQQKHIEEEIFLIEIPEDEGEKLNTERRKSEKYLQVGFQFLKKKVIEKIKKSAMLMKERSQEIQIQKKTEQFYFKDVLIIEPMKVHTGTLKLDNSWLEFQYRPSTHLRHISLLKNRQKPTDLLAIKWSLYQIETYQLKKYMLKQNAIQLFFKDKNSVFLSFYGKSQQNFCKFIQLLQKMKKIQLSLQKIPYSLKLFDPFKQNDKFTITEQWKNREISNFNYLMSLNILSGRTNCDLNQYFILPWILSNYRSAKFKKDQSKYRDLDKNMGTLGNTERIQKFIEIKNTIEQNHKQQFVQSHFFGFHYSNLPIVLQYMIRVNPYAEGAMQLQGGKFDIPDRLFTSIADSFKNATSEMSDVRELIPEFFYMPEFLINCQEFDFGVQQNSKRVNNVELPDGFANAYDFIEAHREELESEEVSLNLHKWIDLVFGFKQYGKEAELSFNKFHYLSYESNANSIFHEDKSDNKESIESQIAYFGKVPSQIFTKPHPKRNPINNVYISQYSEGYTRANPFINQKEISPIKLSQMIKHVKGVFSLHTDSCIHFKYCEINKKYLILLRNGKGVMFHNEKSDINKDIAHQRYLSITSPVHFQIFLDKFEQVYIFDETIEFQQLPICSLWSEHLFIGGLWGGKILKYDIITKQFQMHSKHSDTVTAISGSEQLQILVSGTINGQMIIWEYINKSNNINYAALFQPYAHSSRKLIYKNKIVVNSKRINQITINNDLRMAVCACDDGLLSLIDLERFEVVRIIRIGEAIKNAQILTSPYYMFFISCEKNKQYCYSLNGQYLDESNYQQLHPQVGLCTINGHQERIVIKKKGQACFSLLKLPQLREEVKIEIKNEDNEVLAYQVAANMIDVEILFYTTSHLIYCSNAIQNNGNNKQRSNKKSKQ